MITVVCQVIAGFGVREDGKAVPVEGEPREDLSKELGREGDLIASGRMRSNGIVTPPAHLNIKALFYGSPQTLGS